MQKHKPDCLIFLKNQLDNQVEKKDFSQLTQLVLLENQVKIRFTFQIQK